MFPNIKQSIEEELKPTIDATFRALEAHVVAAFAELRDEISTALENNKPGHDDFYEEMQQAREELSGQLSPLRERYEAMSRAIVDIETCECLKRCSAVRHLGIEDI